MPSKAELRKLVQDNLDAIAASMNTAMQGRDLDVLEPVLARIGRGKVLPHWYAKLKENGTLPNLDGKTVGSVIEMLLVAVLEAKTFHGLGVSPLKINPARGVDLPDLDLGVKSPSKNFDTSEPYFSAYERLLGGEHDMVVLVTDYQTAKIERDNFGLQLIKWRYLKGSQIADKNLCSTARAIRAWLLASNEAWVRKIFRFLAYVNQGDWLARQLLRMVEVLNDETKIAKEIARSIVNFDKTNKKAIKEDKVPNPDSDLECVKRIGTIAPLHLGVIDATQTWVDETQKESGRMPNDNEWNRLVSSSLDGLIGMSFALQWRYNFRQLFNGSDTPTLDDEGELPTPSE